MLNTQLRAFNAVARHGSFSKAADALAVTQPALTLQVKALEGAYGVKLFTRNGRRIALTDAGARLFKVSRRLHGIEEEVRDVLSASNELVSGHFTVAADGPHIAMGLFARFMARHPRLEVAVAMGNTQFVRRQLFDGHADVAILPNAGGHRRLHAIELYQHRAVVVVANDHPWAQRTEVDIKELAGQPMLGREAGSNTQLALRAALQQARVRVRFVLELGSREAVCEAVAAGIGIGVVWELEAQASTRVRSLAIRNATIKSTDYVACLKGERSRRAIMAFFETAAEARLDRLVRKTRAR